MNEYVNASKLIKSINNYQEGAKAALNPTDGDADYYKGKIDACKDIQEFITSLQQEQPGLPDMEGARDYYYHKGLYTGMAQGRADALKILEEFAKSKADPVIVIKQEEQPKMNIPSAGSGAMGTTHEDEKEQEKDYVMHYYGAINRFGL